MSLLEEPSFLFDVILVLRCLSLKTTNPDKWSELNALDASVDHQDLESRQRTERIAGFVFTELNVDYPDEDDDTIAKILGILDTNSFEARIPGTPGSIQATYGSASMAEHNCLPNGYKVRGMQIMLVNRIFFADSVIRIPVLIGLNLTFTKNNTGIAPTIRSQFIICPILFTVLARLRENLMKYCVTYCKTRKKM